MRQVGNVHHRVDSECREVAGCRDAVDAGAAGAAKNDNSGHLVAVFRVKSGSMYRYIDSISLFIQ